MMMRARTIWAPALLGVALIGAVAPADAANCAVRNPDRQIREIFGATTSDRTEVAAIDDTLKRAIEKRLGSSLSMTDVGKHTACVVLQEGVPVGFVHARTETGSRGSVELIWAMEQAWVVGEAVTGSLHDQFTALRGSTIASLRSGGAPATGTPGACGLEVLAVLSAANVSDQ